MDHSQDVCVQLDFCCFKGSCLGRTERLLITYFLRVLLLFLAGTVILRYCDGRKGKGNYVVRKVSTEVWQQVVFYILEASVGESLQYHRGLVISEDCAPSVLVHVISGTLF